MMMMMMMMMMMRNCFCGMVDWQKALLALFPAGTIVGDPHHREPLARREQALNLCKTYLGFDEWSSAVFITTTPRCHKSYFF